MIRQATRADLESLAVLRSRLWPSASTEEHQQELLNFFSGDAREPLEILVSEEPKGELSGFCELSMRAYAESCSTDRVGYLEGWYVEAGHRRRGVGRRLVVAAEEWARAQGCTEFASDAESNNLSSIEAHKALGFEDVGLIRCFRKDL